MVAAGAAAGIIAGVKVYTRRGDDGTTGLLYGSRVRKDDPRPAAYGDVDETQAVLGLVRAETTDDELAAIVLTLQRDLWTVMAEVATAPGKRHQLVAGQSLVTAEMVTHLEATIDDVSTKFEPPREFVLPGSNRTSALLDVARTVARRAERSVISAGPLVDDPESDEPSHAVAYLNRLSDLLWSIARWQETDVVPSRPAD